MKITDQFILLLSPNAAAASNGRKFPKAGSSNPEDKMQTRICIGRSVLAAVRIHIGRLLTSVFLKAHQLAGVVVPADSSRVSMHWD